MIDQITAEELAGRIDAGDSFVLVDTRPADSYGSWHIAGAENVPYDPREGLDEDGRRRVRELADGKPVMAICGKGLTSTSFAFDVEADGVDVAVVRGGMEEWGRVYEVVPIVERLVESAPEKPPNYEDVIGINLGADDVPAETEATELEVGPNNCAA